jgi:hypothetical protein
VFKSSLLLEFNDQLALVLGCLGLYHVVVVAPSIFKGLYNELPGAVFVALVELVLGVLAEDLLALFAGENNLRCPEQLVILALHVALGAVEPFLAALGTD